MIQIYDYIFRYLLRAKSLAIDKKSDAEHFLAESIVFINRRDSQ